MSENNSQRTKVAAFLRSSDAIAVLAFLVNLFLVLNLFLPSMRDVNLWDESVYVNTGRSLAHGELTVFSRNPLVGVLYALTYLLFQNSDFWLVQSVSLGRVLLFGILWWGAYLSFRQLREFVPPLVVTGFLFTSIALTRIVVNPSDALFAGVSAFAFWQVLALYRTREVKHVWRASLLVGLSALARNDGLVLFAVFLVIVIILLWKRPEVKKGLLWAVVPFAAVVGGYVLLYGLVTGSFTLGLEGRTFAAFMQGQAHLYRNDPDCTLSAIRCGVLEVQEVYGTPEENNYSVLRAIAGNPQAYWRKVQDTLASLPTLFLKAYGEMPLMLIALLGLRGAVELLRKKKGLLLVVMALWGSYLGVYFITFFRRGYLMMIFYLLFALAGLGLAALARGLANRQERLVWSGLLGVGVLAGIIFGIQALYLVCLLVLAILWIGALAQEQGEGSGKALPVFFLFLVLGVLLTRTFNPPVFTPYGTLPEEEALVLIREEIPEGSPVAAGAPGWVWAADMDYVDLEAKRFNGLADSQALYEALLADGTEAVYVDHYLSNQNEALWRLIEPEIGHYYRQVYSGREGSIRILLVEP
ncbi:MAG TPA: hypothetical protein VJ965_06460 [Anaerolineales bacterium]|nr:hypothetical protein [Anaerolineales bacterium]